MAFVHREALSLILLPIPAVLGVLFYAEFVPLLMARAHASESLAMLGHVRKEVVLERAFRPASQGAGQGDPVVLATAEPLASARTPQTLKRSGDQITARMTLNGAIGEWTFEPVDAAPANSWVSAWHCKARSTGSFQHVAQALCPNDTAFTP